MTPTTITLPPLSVRAAVNSINDHARTVELVFSTGAAVDRVDPWTGKRYREVLSMTPGHVRLDRLNAGAPVLDTHSGFALNDVIGAVEPGSARVESGRGLATVRFSKRERVEAIWQDVRDGIIRNVSVGYRIHKFEESAAAADKVPTRTAVDWEPYEISMVPMPADTGAQVRNGQECEMNECTLVVAQPGANDRSTEEADRQRNLRLLAAISRHATEQDDWTMEDRLLDDVLAYVPVETPDARALAEPLPAQRAIVERAIAISKELGLRLPEHFDVRYVVGAGGVCRRDGECYRIWIGVDAAPDALRQTALHEVKHLADFADPALQHLSRVESERRAIEFAADAMRHR